MIDLAASITSSTITTSLLYPIERLKIEMQLNHEDGSVATNFNNILQQQGIYGFYRGISPLVIGNGVAYGIYFVAYQKLKTLLHTDAKSIVSIIQSSGLAGVISSIFTNPFYVLQTRQSKQGGSLAHIGAKMISQEGLVALWKGLLASLILVSNPIIQFVVYEVLKKKSSSKGKQLSSLITFIIGALSKIVATFFTYPYTLLRARQHVKGERDLPLFEVFKDVLDKQGFFGLFKGFKPKLIQTTLNAALMLMIYEKVRNILTKKMG